MFAIKKNIYGIEYMEALFRSMRIYSIRLSSTVPTSATSRDQVVLAFTPVVGSNKNSTS